MMCFEAREEYKHIFSSQMLNYWEKDDSNIEIVCEAQWRWESRKGDVTVRQKLAILKWMDYTYPSGKYNLSEILRKTCLDRKTKRELLKDRELIEINADGSDAELAFWTKKVFGADTCIVKYV